MKLLITDLDNTLYDWVTYFSRSFEAMVAQLSVTLAIPIEQLLQEFKAVHQRHHNSEHPYALFELASVQARFGALSRAELKAQFDEALHAFNRARKANLQLYPGVLETLATLTEHGTTIVAHTEAIAANAYFRIKFLSIDRFFTRLYAIEGNISPHPVPEREAILLPPAALLRTVPHAERKPNPRLLLDICDRENISPKDTVYVGDSLTRDMSMAKQAGVKAVWAKYGLDYDRDLWKLLVQVTHWSSEDVQREEDLKRQFANVNPDATIQRFDELLALA